jgi:hypothetical protein
MEKREGESGWKDGKRQIVMVWLYDVTVDQGSGDILDGKRQFDMVWLYRYTRWRRNAS